MAKKKYSLTPEHHAQLKPWNDKWIANALSNAPMTNDDRVRLKAAIRGLYVAAGLTPPPDHRIVIVASPMIAAFASGFAAAIWHRRKNTLAATLAATDAATLGATDAATLAATDAATDAAADAATRDATDAATLGATDAATRDATDAATLGATDAATLAATDAATRDAWWKLGNSSIRDMIAAAKGLGGDDFRFLLSCAARSWYMRSGGNQWSGWSSYISFFRHVARLDLSHGIDYSKWEHFEDASVLGGPRYMHEEFCIVSERPEVLGTEFVDGVYLPHSTVGPFCRWRDGSSLYAVHGVRVPSSWIDDPKSLTPSIALSWPNLEQRRVAVELVGWARVLRELKSVVIDEDHPRIGTLIEVDLPDSGKERFLRVRCGTEREFALPVAADVQTAFEANLSTYPALAAMRLPVDDMRSAMINNRT